MTGLVGAAAAAVLTLVLHALLAATAALIGGAFVRDPGVRDKLWKFALVIPWFTALAATVRDADQDGAARATVSVPALVRSQVPGAPPIRATSEVSGTGSLRVVTSRVSDPLTLPLSVGLIALVLIPGAMAGTLTVARRRRLARMLRNRRVVRPHDLGVDVPDGTRVTITRAITGALALRGGEICLSDRLLRMTSAQRRAIVAHELAHLARRDPGWLLWADAVAAALVVVPPVRWVAQRLRRDAEFLCDDRAVRAVNDPATYVEALAWIAAAHDPLAARTAPAAADSPLVQRVLRQLNGPAPVFHPRRALVVALFIGLAALLSAAPRPTFAAAAVVHSEITDSDGRDSVVLEVRIR